MYNAHRGMVPAPPPNARLTELLDQIRAEFDGQMSKGEDYERNSKSRYPRLRNLFARSAAICTSPRLFYFAPWTRLQTVAVSISML